MDDIISDTEARRIASAWHGGQASRLLSLSTTGAIHEDVGAELAACVEMLGAGQYSAEEQAEQGPELAALVAYVEHHGPRGVQAGWSQLHF